MHNEMFKCFQKALRLVVLSQVSSCSVERVFLQLKLMRDTCGDNMLEDMVEVRMFCQCDGRLQVLIVIQVGIRVRGMFIYVINLLNRYISRYPWAWRCLESRYSAVHLVLNSRTPLRTVLHSWPPKNIKLCAAH